MTGTVKNALVVSAAEKSINFFIESLTENGCDSIMTVTSCGAARRLLLDQTFDLVIVNAPLTDENGLAFAKSVALEQGSQVMLLVKADHYDEIAGRVEDAGVFTLSKPLSRSLFWNVLKLCSAAVNRARRMQDENRLLSQKLDDIRIVNRAKCVLIEYLRMSETEAHKYIEKQAMDLRKTRRAVAEDILKTYEN